ncbi:MAG: hypothetical protein ACQETM_06665 [Bacteroidota bacterium]
MCGLCGSGKFRVDSKQTPEKGWVTRPGNIETISDPVKSGSYHAVNNRNNAGGP